MDQPILTTMVVLVYTPYTMNTETLLHQLPIQYPILKVEKQGVLRRGESARDRIRRRTTSTEVRRNTGFGYNSLTIVLMSKGDGTLPEKEITVKLFQNGVFHITGVLDEAYDKDAVKCILSTIREYCPGAMTRGSKEMRRRVVLMNYKTRIRGLENIAREKFYQTLHSDGIKVAYEPSVYPAVKVYFPGQRWIAKVFRTGNVILTGMTTPSETDELMKQLHPLLVKALPSISA